MLYYIAWLLLQPWKLFLRVEGLENIPKKKCKMLVIASHNGELDPWRIGIYFPLRLSISWFAKKEFFDKKKAAKEFNPYVAPFVSMIIRHSKAIPVNKDNEADPINIIAVKKAMRLLKQDKMIGIFPRAKIGEKKHVNANFVRLALKTETLILPVSVNGKRIVFGRSFRIEEFSKDRCLGLAHEIMKKIEAF